MKIAYRHINLTVTAIVIGLVAAQNEPALAQEIEVREGTPPIEIILQDEVPDELRRVGVVRFGSIRLPGNVFSEPPVQRPPPPIKIPIDDDRIVSLVERQRKVVDDNKTYIIGGVESSPTGRFVMQLQNKTLQRGEIRLRNEVINLTAPQPDNGDLVFRLAVFDSSGISNERGPLEPGIPAEASPESVAPADLDEVGTIPEPGQASQPEETETLARPVTPATPVIVDLMVVYTAAGEAAAESIWGVTVGESIEFVVDNANFGYEPQGGVRLNLVHTEQVNYTESGDIGVDVERLACPCDHKFDNIGTNHLNEVFAPWKQHKADVVNLWIDSPIYTDTGIAYAMPNVTTDFAPYAVSVVDVTAAALKWSFDHEVGHNFGARHDRAQTNKFGSPYYYNHGWVNLSQQAVTIMAYTKTCDSFAYDCVRLPIWSDPVYPPANTWGIGSGPFAADNARTLISSAQTVADFDSKHSLVGCCINVGTWLNQKWHPGPCP